MATEAQAERARDLRLRRTYGITSAQYEELFLAQRGRCAICKKPPTKRRLEVDHDHATGVVRGLLCWKCNHLLLGNSDDDSEKLRSAANYLDSPPAVSVLGRIVAPPKPPKRRKRKKKESVG